MGMLGSIWRTAFCERQAERFRRKARADGDEEAVADAEGVGIVNRALGFVFGEPGLFHAADNADDGERLASFPCFGPIPQALANGDGVWPVVPREIFIDDADAARSVRESSSVRKRPARREKPMARK